MIGPVKLRPVKHLSFGKDFDCSINKITNLYSPTNNQIYFMLSSRISRNIGENIFRSYTDMTSENTDFHVLVAQVKCTCVTTRWKYDVIYLTFLALDVIL